VTRWFDSSGGDNTCALSEEWGVDPETMRLVVKSAAEFEEETRRSVGIISGYRTASRQAHLGKQGRPTAPDRLSTHRSCPATGVDVTLGFLPTRVLKARWGSIVVFNGLRWGGGGPVDDGGIPIDWAHVDLGPRRSD